MITKDEREKIILDARDAVAHEIQVLHGPFSVDGNLFFVAELAARVAVTIVEAMMAKGYR